MFSTLHKTKFSFSPTFILLSADAFNLNQFKNLLFGKELRYPTCIIFQVLDELLCILRTLQSTDQPPRSHEFLQELRDISSMAMEHFDEKIAPGLKSKLPPVSLPYPFSESCPCPMDPNPGIYISFGFTKPFFIMIIIE